jgi:hypothetical protein
MCGTGLDERAKTALAEAKAVFDVDEMKRVGPHELAAVVVSDGFSGREHMWTYIKADDGRWFKSLDQSVTEVLPFLLKTLPLGAMPYPHLLRFFFFFCFSGLPRYGTF